MPIKQPPGGPNVITTLGRIDPTYTYNDNDCVCTFVVYRRRSRATAAAATTAANAELQSVQPLRCAASAGGAGIAGHGWRFGNRRGSQRHTRRHHRRRAQPRHKKVASTSPASPAGSAEAMTLYRYAAAPMLYFPAFTARVGTYDKIARPRSCRTSGERSGTMET